MFSERSEDWGRYKSGLRILANIFPKDIPDFLPEKLFFYIYPEDLADFLPGKLNLPSRFISSRFSSEFVFHSEDDGIKCFHGQVEVRDVKVWFTFVYPKMGWFCS